MLTNRRARLGFAITTVAFSVGMLTGCQAASSAPSASGKATSSPPVIPSSTPTIPPESIARATKIVVDGARLTVIGSDKTTLLELPFKTGGPAAVIALARLMGEEPQVVDVPATQCNSHETTAKWGAAFWVTYVIDSVDPNELNRFSISSQKAATGGGVNIETQSGFSVGDPIHDLIAGTPNVEVQDSAGDGTTAWIGMDANQTGTMAASDPGTGLVRLIAAPASRNADC